MVCCVLVCVIQVATVMLDYATTHRCAARLWLPLGGAGDKQRGEIQLSVSFKT